MTTLIILTLLGSDASQLDASLQSSWKCEKLKNVAAVRGATQIAFGAPLVITGTGGTLTGALGALGARDVPEAMAIYGIAAGVSAVTAVIGLVLLKYGRENLGEGLEPGCR